jgi:hypothetical protein
VTRLGAGLADPTTAGPPTPDGPADNPADDPADGPADEPAPADRGRQIASLAERCRRDLADALRDAPDLADLRPTAIRVGGNLVRTLGELLDGRSALLDVPGATAEEREDHFVAGFVTAVGGNGGLVSDAVARRAARRAAEQLLGEGSPVADALRDGGETDARISGELFCTVYRHFFGEYVGEFVRTAVGEGIALAAAPLALPVDPTGLVAGAVARQVMKILPDPCDAAADRQPRDGLLTTVAGELLTDVVDRALGIQPEEVTP